MSAATAIISTAPPPPRLATVATAAHYLGVSPRSIRRCLDDGILTPRRVRGRVLVDYRDLDRLAEGSDSDR